MNDVLEYLINYGYDHNVGVITTRLLAPDTPSSSDGFHRVIIINMNWHDQKAVPFTIAHELGHILNGDKGVNSYCAASNSNKDEYRANCTAIDLLLSYCCSNDIHVDNPVSFCERFGIPTELEYVVALNMSKY